MLLLHTHRNAAAYRHTHIFNLAIHLQQSPVLGLGLASEGQFEALEFLGFVGAKHIRFRDEGLLYLSTLRVERFQKWQQWIAIES